MCAWPLAIRASSPRKGRGFFRSRSATEARARLASQRSCAATTPETGRIERCPPDGGLDADRAAHRLDEVLRDAMRDRLSGGPQIGVPDVGSRQRPPSTSALGARDRGAWPPHRGSQVHEVHQRTDSDRSLRIAHNAMELTTPPLTAPFTLPWTRGRIAGSCEGWRSSTATGTGIYEHRLGTQA